MKSYLSLFLLIFLFISCSEEDSFTPQTEADIIAYVEKNDLSAQKSSSGLYYVIENAGTGKRPTSTSTVNVSYKGYFLDGSVFDQNSDGLSIGLNQVIKGWTEGIPLFREGGNGILLVPSNLGYGNSGRGNIPGGAVLVFDIKLNSTN